MKYEFMAAGAAVFVQVEAGSQREAEEAVTKALIGGVALPKPTSEEPGVVYVVHPVGSGPLKLNRVDGRDVENKEGETA